MSTPSYKLNTGAEIPAIGFGTWQLKEGLETANSVGSAIKTGYRLVDTAKIYGNEQSVGMAVKAGDVPRDQLFITTKLWPSDFGYESGLDAFHISLGRLGLEYLDLYLLHWPNGPERSEAWRALEKIQQDGLSRSVGVSNYEVDELDELFENSDLIPAVNQIEFHPFIYRRQKPTLELCEAKGIVVEAYSPLTVGRRIMDPTISAVAKQIGKSNAQVILRWCVQHNTVPIPRSTNPDHIQENIQIFDFELSSEQMRRIDSLSDSAWHPNGM
jgi:diketogulonate reductase-like aldo/keto reductase